MDREYKFLERFKISNKPFYDNLSTVDMDFVNDVIKLAKKRKDLTYAGTYASLEYAYNYLKYESNFVTVK